MNFATILPSVTALVFALGTASYFFPQESIRGGGRVVLALAGVLVGICFLVPVTPPTWAGWLVVVSGLVTGGAGLRKYLRRNLPQTN